MAHVLIVDDSPTDVRAYRGMLERAGHRVSAVGCGTDALDLIRQEMPDCVVMDVIMPGVNGFQATRTLSRDPQTQHIPIIVFCSKDQKTDRFWALRQGACEYLIKPVKEPEFLAKIEKFLGQ